MTQPETAAPPDAATDVASLSAIIERVMALSDRPTVSVRDIVTGFGEASFLPFLMVPALIVVSPLSGIPLLSTVCGICIAIISLQMLMPRHRHLWLPERLMRQRIATGRLVAGLRRIEGPARWIDARAHQRLHLLVRPPLSVLAQVMCVLCGAAMPFLELVPFSSSILASAVVLFGVGFLARDGLFTLAGLIIAGLGGSIPFIVVSAATGI
jgi:hypothetical protein